jgi:MoaA/NifB/PqqE/SkfB family radical SAM enzyme
VSNCSVFVENGIKKFRSNNVNYNFNLDSGYTEVWGETQDDNPVFSPYGSFIADIEITTECSGIKGKLCPYCYKSNTSCGNNMSFETFQKIINKINVNGQLQQVAFGLGSSAEENPDLWKMCDWLRSQNIIPNGTIADVSLETTKKIGTHFGAVAISYHNDFEVLAQNCLQFAPFIKFRNSNGNHFGTLRQLNIHFVIMEETFEECKKLFGLLKSDKRFMAVNAVVLLGLKKCGRAENGNFHRISDEHFQELVDIAFEENIGIGFDSCDANRFSNAVQDRDDFDKLEQLIEPCESKLFSIYLNYEGKVFPCSFNEKNRNGFEVLKSNNFLEDYWNNDSDGWRDSLKNSGRSCPVYEV